MTLIPYRELLHTVPLATSFVLTATGVVLAFLPFVLDNRLFSALEKRLSRFATRPWRPACALFLFVVIARLLVLHWLPRPLPGIHDEFSYLLMADTFAHGRLANPSHSMWISFETFHINFLPTYSSIYPPVQGLVLAVGQLLGSPWIGVILAVAAMCAAIFWMLKPWLPARWAFLGAALVALKFGVASYWINSYWGGATAAIGGALVLGALPRIARRANTRDALLLGLGVAILANSRPYEGLLFCLPAAIWLIAWLFRRTKIPQNQTIRIKRVAIPLALVLAGMFIFMGYYNWRLTGNALLLPHVLNTRTYHSSPLFLWEQAKAPLTYHNQQFEDFYNGWERKDFDGTWSGIWRVSTLKIRRVGATYLWPGILLAIPAVPFLLFDRRIRLLLFTFATCTVGVFVVTWSNPHYAAPLTCVIFALLVQAIRHLRTMQIWGRPLGKALSRAIVVLLILDTGMYVARGMCDPMCWACQGDISRVTIADKLEHAPGKHLVMVRYDKDHNIHDEWVYNGADLDNAKVLWARELDPEQNAKLFAYYKDRKVWLVTPDTDNTRLTAYVVPKGGSASGK